MILVGVDRKFLHFQDYHSLFGRTVVACFGLLYPGNHYRSLIAVVQLVFYRLCHQLYQFDLLDNEVWVVDSWFQNLKNMLFEGDVLLD